MTMLAFVLLGLLIGFFRAGGISGLARIPLRAPWLIAVSLLLQAAIAVGGPRFPDLYNAYILYLQAARFLPLLLFALLNVRVWQVALAGVGVALNCAVILTNGGRMPISWTVLANPALTQSVQRVLQGNLPDYMVMTAPDGAKLWFLGDMLAYRVGSAVGYASAGDLLLGVGVMLLIQHAMARYGAGNHVRGSLMRTQSQSVPAKAAKPMAPSIPNPAPIPPIAPIVNDAPQNPLKGSPRLQVLADLVYEGSRVADVGCDHGKLAVYLAQHGAPLVIATDVSQGSLSKAEALVRESGLQGRVECRRGDGLARIKPGEVDTLVIAGMGGSTICAILAEGRRVTDEAYRLVLQPMNAIGTVRRWLAENGFALVDEQLVEDDGRIYQVLCAAHGEERRPAETLFDLEIGRLLREQGHPLLGRLLRERITTIDGILDEIVAIDSPKANARRLELMELRRQCEEAMP